MSLETNSANEIRANWFNVKFKLIIIDLTLFVNRAQNVLERQGHRPYYQLNIKVNWSEAGSSNLTTTGSNNSHPET